MKLAWRINFSFIYNRTFSASQELLSVFERLPDHDGSGVFRVHWTEDLQGDEPTLFDRFADPCDFNLTMLNRILYCGITNEGHESLIA